MGVPTWLLGTVDGYECMIQGLDAADYYMAGRHAACVGGSGNAIRDADCMPRQSQGPCLLCTCMLSVAVSDPCAPVYTRVG